MRLEYNKKEPKYQKKKKWPKLVYIINKRKEIKQNRNFWDEFGMIRTYKQLEVTERMETNSQLLNDLF